MSHSIFIQTISTKYGELLAGTFKDKLCLLDWKYRAKRHKIDQRIMSGLNASYIEEHSPLHTEVAQQILAYSQGILHTFELPLLMVGSAFQQNVWNALLKIPYGTTCTYLALSKRLGDEKAIRAVASANGANALSIVVPCHRIIGSDGALIGYAGGIATKKKLLITEGYRFQPELF